MKRVIVESPYAGNVGLNVSYLRACMADCIRRGEAPYASHGLYTQPGVLRDGVPEERKLGIEAGFAWRSVAEATIVYIDLGVTVGMEYGIGHALEAGRPVECPTCARCGDWQPSLNEAERAAAAHNREHDAGKAARA